MCGNDWLSDGLIAIVAGLIGLFAAPMVDAFWVWWRGPKLEASFAKNDCVITSPDTLNHVQLYFRIRVTNTLPRIAEGVRAWLVNIQRLNEDTGDYEATDYKDCLPLIFSDQRGIESASIPKGITWHVDVVMLHPKVERWHACLRGAEGEALTPLRYTEGLYTEPGTFRMTINVTAQHLSPIECKLYFKWDGKPGKAEFVRFEPQDKDETPKPSETKE